MATNNRDVPNERKLPAGLNTLFLIHVVVAFLMGIVLFLTPEYFGNVTNWDGLDPTVARMIGGANVSVAYLSWLGYQTPDWDVGEALVKFEVVYPALFGLAGLYEVGIAGAPDFTWVIVVITAVFFVAFLYFYWKMRENNPLEERS